MSTNNTYSLATLKATFDKAQQQFKEFEDQKIYGLSPVDYMFNKFQQSIDPIYFIENVLRAHLPESRRHLHSNQIELIQAVCNPNIRRVAAMMARQCFKKNTLLIDANNELISVENIKIGTKLKTPDNKYATVIATTQGIAQLYKISSLESYDTPYYVTDNHHLVLTNKKEKVIISVKDYLMNPSKELLGLKCITYDNNQHCSQDEINTVINYLPNDIALYKKILNSSLEDKYIFIQEFLGTLCTNGLGQRYTTCVANISQSVINLLIRIFNSMGYSVKIINQFMFITYNLYYPIYVTPDIVDTYYGFTLDSSDNLCVLSDNTVTHNSGKCFAKDTLIRLYDGSVKQVQDIVQTDVLMGSDSKPRYIDHLARGVEQMANIYTDLSHFSVNLSHDLVVFDDNDKKHYIDVKTYYDNNLKMKMKIVPWEYNKTVFFDTAYNAGYNYMFEQLLHTSINTRKHVLAGIIDTSDITRIKNGINLRNINISKKQQMLELIRSLGFIVFVTHNGFNILGDFSTIPVRNKKEINDINYKNQYINFSVVPGKEDVYYGFTLKGDNKEFLLADGTVVKNTESIACMASYLICTNPQMRIGIFTPRVQQAEVTIGRATVFFQMNEDKIPYKIAKLTKQRIELTNGSYMQAVSGSDQSNIEGLTFDIIILDEAQKISNYTWSERIVPMGGL